MTLDPDRQMRQPTAQRGGVSGSGLGELTVGGIPGALRGPIEDALRAGGQVACMPVRTKELRRRS